MKGLRDWRVWASAGIVLAVAGGTFALLAPRQHTPPSLPQTAPSTTPPAWLTAPPKVAAAVPRSTPVRLIIPSIGVNAAVLSCGVGPGTCGQGSATTGPLQTPPLSGPQADDAGWWDGGAAPGQDGPAVIAGHVNSAAMGDLVFANLGKLAAGEAVEVVLKDGADEWFTVTSTQQVSKSAFPTQAVYGPTRGPTLRLITCGGAFDPSSGHYTDNVIVYATKSVPSG